MTSSCGRRFFRLAAGALLAAALLSGAPKSKVFAPVFVGRPPSDAYIGLSRLPSGEIRDDTYGEPADWEDPFYIVSFDNGFTWRRRQLPKGSVAADQRSPPEHALAEWRRRVDGCGVERRRIWMLMRTSQDNHYESFPRDGGESWEPARLSRFYATLTMPTLGRLKDGRILLLWNNTTALPEVARHESDRFFLSSGVLDGSSEDVFTNRDVMHAAISADDGRTWQGFRQLYLNARRNDRDFAETRGVDCGVHQSQFVDLNDESVLVSLGQHWMHRALVVFHPDWLLAKTRSSNFENGLTDWSVHMFIAGIRGHCAFNRKVGADLIAHPQAEGSFPGF